MKIDSSALSATQKNALALAALYTRYGYAQYKMSKFEEYDLYNKNKGFLVNEGVITFTDTDGKLLALKPDVTLSIVKNADKALAHAEKLFYNESVYRVSKSTGSFKEITQAGVECFGKVDAYHISEVLLLAAKSLQVFQENFILEVSHIGILNAFIRHMTSDSKLTREIWKCVNEKNIHSIMDLCAQNEIDAHLAQPLKDLLSLSGTPAQVLPQLERMVEDFSLHSEFEEFKNTLCIFEGSDVQDKILIDFSAVGNIHYYNGIVFNGFVDGVPESVLSGGQYDALMSKMKKSGRAIGFAVYLDLLERMAQSADAFDVDVMLVYESGCSVEEIARTVHEFQAQQKSVFAADVRNDKLKAKQVYSLQKGRLEIIENNA